MATRSRAISNLLHKTSQLSMERPCYVLEFRDDWGSPPSYLDGSPFRVLYLRGLNYVEAFRDCCHHIYRISLMDTTT